jgi:hypothetical protein
LFALVNISWMNKLQEEECMMYYPEMLLTRFVVGIWHPSDDAALSGGGDSIKGGSIGYIGKNSRQFASYLSTMDLATGKGGHLVQ